MNVSAQNKGFDFLQKKMYDGGKSNYVMIFAHRGNWRGAPENSLQAYKQCIDGGIDGVEIDVHMTKDSAIVMMHDDTVDRTTTGTGLVSDYTLEEIKKLVFPIIHKYNIARHNHTYAGTHNLIFADGLTVLSYHDRIEHAAYFCFR